MSCEASKQNLNLKFSNIRLINYQESFSQVNGTHIMCKNCLTSITNSIKKKPAKAEKDGNYALECKICNTNHLMTKESFDATFKVEEPCKCLIF